MNAAARLTGVPAGALVVVEDGVVVVELVLVDVLLGLVVAEPVLVGDVVEVLVVLLDEVAVVAVEVPA